MFIEREDIFKNLKNGNLFIAPRPSHWDSNKDVINPIQLYVWVKLSDTQAKRVPKSYGPHYHGEEYKNFLPDEKIKVVFEYALETIMLHGPDLTTFNNYGDWHQLTSELCEFFKKFTDKYKKANNSCPKKTS